MKVIEIAGDKFVAGLEWFTVEKKQLSKFLKEKNAKRYVKVISKNNKYINIGIPREEVQDRSLFKYPALAPSLASVKNTSWAGVFRIDDNTYYHIAVGNDNIILPDGDVIGSREDAMNAYFKNLELLDEWGELISEGTIDDLYNFMFHTKKRYKFNSEILLFLENITDKRILYIISAIAIAAIIGLFLVYKMEIKKRATHLNFAVIKRMQQQRKKMAIHKTTVSSVYPLVKACYKAYYRAMIRDIGWSVQSATCTPESITIQLARNTSIPVARSYGLHIISPSQAVQTIKPHIQTVKITAGFSTKVQQKLNEFVFQWPDINLVKQLKTGYYTVTGQSNLALGKLLTIKGIYAKDFVLTNSWKLDFVTRGKPTQNTGKRPVNSVKMQHIIHPKGAPKK